MQVLPELRVRMFLNVPRPYLDSTPQSELLQNFAIKFKTKEWPALKPPDIYYDRRALAASNHERASLHAKCIVVDEQRAFVTSANFTEAAQARNIEAGVLVVDSVFAKSLVRQFEAQAACCVVCLLIDPSHPSNAIRVGF
jgi:phosphatidylserine/phosphatidylglycerophosphate/cardiolipin synthase-like enzyme